MQSSLPVDSGEILKITMALGDDSVSFRGKVVYVTRSEERDFQFGISIKDIAKEDKIALRRFIYYFKEPPHQ